MDIYYGDKEFYRPSQEDDRLDLADRGIHVNSYEFKPVYEINPRGENTEENLEETIAFYLGKDI